MKKRLFMKKHLFSLLVCLALLMTGCQSAVTSVPPTAVAQPTAAPSSTVAPSPTTAVSPTAAITSTPAEIALTLTGLDGKAKDFTMEELKKFPAAEGQAGIKSSTGKITPPALFKGVLLTDLLKEIGGTDSTMGIQIEAKDGYAMTFSADQLTSGDFIAYDPATGDETKAAGNLQALVAYEMDGKPLDLERDGLLRLVVISEKNNQVTDGHWSIKWVRKIEIKQLAEEWDLQLEGGITDTIDRGTFESCSTNKCHPATYKDGKAQTWGGTPLWYIAGRMDDEIKHGDGSFNKDLAAKGYTVEVVGKDGYSATFEIARLIGNNNIILANTVNGNQLTDADFPLKLTGSDVTGKESVSSVQKILLHFDQTAAASAPTSTATAAVAAAAPTEKPEPIILAPGKALMINGLVGKELDWSIDELKKMDVIKLTVEHPKKGKQDVEGVRINALLDLAAPKAEGSRVIFTAVDGFTATADLKAIRGCKDCLVAFNESGGLKLAMPGMDSGLWVKNIIGLTIQ